MTSLRSLTAVTALSAAALMPSSAYAQAAAPPAVTAGWQDGFFIQSADGDFRLQVGLLAHVDCRFALGDSSQAVVNGSSRKAEAWTAGLNWYLTPDFKYVFNVERTVFDGDPDGPRKAENVLAFRTQVAF